jgi:hypothetical protein
MKPNRTISQSKTSQKRIKRSKANSSNRHRQAQQEQFNRGLSELAAYLA